LYYILIYSKFQIKKKCKKKLKKYRGSNAWRSELLPLALSARPRLLLGARFYELIYNIRTRNLYTMISRKLLAIGRVNLV